MTTAHELHAKGLREHLAPALRALGLVGWRRTFSLPDDTHWVLLGLVERPAADRVPFTFRLSLVRRADWAAVRRPDHRPDPRTRYGFEVWRARIGEVLPIGEDVWWEVLPGPRWQLALDDAVAAVRHYGLPELRRRAEADRTPTGETYLSPAELEEVNTALLTASVARVQRAELADKALVLTGAWTRGDGVARTVLAGAARGFLSAGDERFRTVRCRDTLGRELWVFP
ncbi:hypothetical protein [Kitasatospora sp. SUK 42]|uniref:hypothetical protein n=1 Tax=Kitasatospora sp. SUK 42 TaxID=1588882 RepID=UPI0018C9C954|nr:hypothetical protein [Kitasatospora sp. SUK 42]MBV2154702.1 DUF4304 domain-containing protein [Kitasatospora sp. SUK 42]